MSRGVLLSVLPWLLPPLLGAVIGYVTNAIAIRMLFRPLLAKRIFGLRLPLTPGIIPKQRYELAESIGRMVSRELITEEAIKGQLATESFRSRFGENLDSLLEQLLSTPLSRLRGGGQQAFASGVEAFLSESLFRFFSSRSFIHGVRTILTRLVTSLAGKPLAELAPPQRVAELLVRRALPALTGQDGRRRVAAAVRRWAEGRRGTDSPLAEVVPEAVVQPLGGFVAGLLPFLFEALLRWLQEEDTRRQLEIRGKRLLRDVLDRLNLLQKFIISAGQFDRTLEQKMPEIIDDALEHLRRYAEAPKTVEDLRRVVEETLQRWLVSPGRETLGRVDPDRLSQAVEKALAALGSPAVAGRLSQAVQRWLGRLEGRTVREVAARYLGLGEPEVIDYLSNQVLSYLSRQETSRTIASEVVSFSVRFLEEHGEQSLGEVLHVSAELRSRAGAYLTDRVIRILDSRLPALIDSFNVQQLVVDKINSLDVAQVEKLLLMVIARHLKWINLFGALLGAVIGFSQMILRLFV